MEEHNGLSFDRYGRSGFFKTMLGKLTPIYVMLIVTIIMVISLLITVIIMFGVVKDMEQNGDNILTVDDLKKFCNGSTTNNSTIAPPPPPSPPPEPNNRKEQPLWQNSQCIFQCKKENEYSKPPLLVISMDGYANYYLERGFSPTLNSIAECGAYAKGMYPSYPSETLPNHYSIATGLFPESHGIVGNYIYEPTFNPDVFYVGEKANETLFSGGEPIWSAAVRQKLRANCLMWFGCSYNITGYNPTVNIPFDENTKFSTRVDMIVDWLLLPEPQRPSLIMAYFNEPDHTGHNHKTDEEVNMKLAYMDSILNYLFTSLYSEQILDCINIVIVSDHGMIDIKKKIFLSDIMDISGMKITSGVTSNVFLDHSTKTKDYITDKFKCYDSKLMQIYDRQRTPVRYHYRRSSRVGDFLFNGQPGAMFYSSHDQDYPITANHGYDYLNEKMHAIFFARGPNIKQGVTLPIFQNIELFNMFTDLLRINNDVPNNGTVGILDGIYRNLDVKRADKSNDFVNAPECEKIMNGQREIESCAFGERCLQKTRSINEWLTQCNQQNISEFFYIPKSSDFCTINLCSNTLLTKPQQSSLGQPTVLYEILRSTDISSDRRRNGPNDGCYQYESRYESSCNSFISEIAKNQSEGMIWKDFQAFSNSRFSGLTRLQVLMHKNFYEGQFNNLQRLTEYYAKKYGTIVSISGTIYDTNFDGLADDNEVFAEYLKTNPTLAQMPTHLFRILMRCTDNLWEIDGINCKHSQSMQLLAFVLPNQDDINCLSSMVDVLINTARIKDIELLTNVEFFAERKWYPINKSISWRTNVSKELWK